MRMQMYMLIGLIFLAILISLGGCMTKVTEEPWMFYQAHDPIHGDAPAPFFLTMQEAQAFVSKMNEDSNNSYQVSFIAR